MKVQHNIGAIRHLPFESLNNEALEYMQNAFNLEFSNPANHLFIRERGWNGIINDESLGECFDPNINSKEVNLVS